MFNAPRTPGGPTPVDLYFRAEDSDGFIVNLRRDTVAFPPC